jgi:hypothetical protein
MAYYGIYRGTVTSAADPTMKGRLQVSVPAVGGMANSWAAPCRDYRSTATPPVGSPIWVMFEGGNPTFPVWMGCAS